MTTATPSASSTSESEASSHRQRAPLYAVAAIIGLAVAYLLYLQRGSYFFFDDWDYVAHRTYLQQGALLGPQNQNLFAATPIVYLILGKLFGLASYLPFKLADLAVHAAITALLYAYAAPRVGRWWALLPAAALALTSASEIVLWPLQIGQLISLFGGIASLVVLDRRSGLRWLLLVAVLLFVSVASSSAGVPMVALVAFDRLLRPGARLQVLAAAPATLFYIWWHGEWGKLSPTQNEGGIPGINTAIRQSFDSAQGGMTFTIGAQHMEYLGSVIGQLAVVGLFVLVCWRLFGPYAADRVRILALCGGLATFWFLLAYGRGFMPLFNIAPRYIMISQLMLLMLFVELGQSVQTQARDRAGLFARGWIGWVTAVGVIGLAAFAVLGGARSLRGSAVQTRVEGAAARGQVAAIGLLTPQQRQTATFFMLPRASGFGVSAQEYVVAPWKRFGTDLPTEADVKAMPELERAWVDGSLLRTFSTLLAADAPRPVAAGPAPVLTAPADVQLRTGAGSCTRTIVSDGAATLPVPADWSGAITNKGTGQLVLQGRRYASGWTDAVPLVIDPGQTRTLSIPQDQGRAPWELRLLGGDALFCTTQG